MGVSVLGEIHSTTCVAMRGLEMLLGVGEPLSIGAPMLERIGAEGTIGIVMVGRPGAYDIRI